jgi:hypothetical protein
MDKRVYEIDIRSRDGEYKKRNEFTLIVSLTDKEFIDLCGAIAGELRADGDSE